MALKYIFWGNEARLWRGQRGMSEDLGRKEQTGESWSLTGRKFSWEWLMRSERGAF